MKIVLRLDDLTVFVRTADRGSLSAAARELEISPALASAAVKRLEGELGLRLFARTTRSLRLTEEGEHYLGNAREALRLLKEGHDALIQGQATLGGTLKISMPSDLGRNMVIAWLDEFQALYPKVSFQLSISDRVSDMYRQPVDIAIRYGRAGGFQPDRLSTGAGKPARAGGLAGIHQTAWQTQFAGRIGCATTACASCWKT